MMSSVITEGAQQHCPMELVARSLKFQNKQNVKLKRNDKGTIKECQKRFMSFNSPEIENREKTRLAISGLMFFLSRNHLAKLKKAQGTETIDVQAMITVLHSIAQLSAC